MIGPKGQKTSTKGVQLAHNLNDAISYENFKKILFGAPDALTTVHNFGIRLDRTDGAVKTYVQEAQSLGPLNIKRIFFPDGSSVPLLL